MTERWYASDPSTRLDQAQRPRADSRDQLMGEAIQEWARLKDPRHRAPAEAFVLLTYEDGFSLQYLGPQMIDAHELIRRVVWIGDNVREARNRG